MKSYFLAAFAAMNLCACFSSPVPESVSSSVPDASCALGCPVRSMSALPQHTVVAAPGMCIDGAGIHHLPDSTLTPGVLCTPSDPNFEGYRYPAHIAYCRRNIPASEKDQVAKAYGIPKSDYSKYEFDHLIPLNAGGSDDPRNLWPQPIDEAHEKDKVEDEVYNGLRSGKMTQDEAVAKIHAWRPSTCP